MKNKASHTALGLAAVSLTLVAFAAWMNPGGYFYPDSENEFIRTLRKKTSAYNTLLPQDRVYVDFDKPFYEPGETMWLSVFVRDGQSLKPSHKSDIVHVELLNPKGTVEKTLNLIATDGIAAADFQLDKEILGGMYKVRAYTNWMKNEGQDNVFQKDIQVQDIVLPNLKMKLDFEKKAFGAGDEVIAKLSLNTNENKALADHAIKFVATVQGQKLTEKADITDADGVKYIKFQLPAKLNSSDGLLNVMIDYNGNTESISRSIPIVLNKISFSAFPEGGDLVNGLESHVAFRALNEFGKPADVEGIVCSKKGTQITSFSSFHQGMGAFRLCPQPNESYYVKITKPEGIAETFPLPEALPRGYVMNTDPSKQGEVDLDIRTTETEELSLVAQERGKIYYNTVIHSKAGSNKLAFSTAGFPIGVTQITLFDSKGIARCERLAFVNKDKQLSISIETDKDKYLPREKVKLSLSVKDERGLPMPANLSLAVVNDQLLSFADDKSGTLLSQLLLEQDLSTKVEEPAYYFDKKEAGADEALDYLLMSAGWRCFTWEKVMSDNIAQPVFQGEKTLVSGTVLNATTGKILANARIRINNGAEYKTDENGRFIFNKLDLSSPVTLTCQADGFQPGYQSVGDYNQNLAIYLYDNNYYNNLGYQTRGAGMNMVPACAPMGGGAMNIDREDANEQRPHKMANKRKERNFKAAEQELDKGVAVVVNAKIVKDEEKGEKAKEKKNRSKHEDAKAGFFADDIRANLFHADSARSAGQISGSPVYYRARKFAAPVYDKQETVETRTDFRNTIYWNPNVEIDKSGKKTLEFYASDDITSFRVTTEGIASDGMPGRMEKTFFTQLPFAMSTKVPVEVATEDKLSIPLTLKNNTDKPLGGILTITAPNGLKELVQIPSVQTIMPGKARTIYLDYEVLDKIGYGDFTIAFKSCGLGDAFTQKIKIAPKGFPVNVSFSGQEAEKDFSFSTAHVVPGSIQAQFTAYPNVVSDLMKGIEGILREPYGCFEQTSMSSYPNAMVLDYLQTTDSKDDKALANASSLLDKGYKRLVTFETKDHGYEWFGSNPGHEALTAYGLMQFNDMKHVGEKVDPAMLDRTINWLNSRKDGKGGFLRSSEAADAFGRANEDITNAYIVYALSEAGFTDIKKEFGSSYNKAIQSGDPYQLALMTCTAYNLNEKEKASQALDILLPKQAKDGSWNGLTHSVTCSTGQSLLIETTSLGIMAILKSNDKGTGPLMNAVKYLVASRNGSGSFGNTQGTILALKALTSFAKFSKKTTEDGTILVYVDGKKAGEKSYKAGDNGAIVIDGMEQYLQNEGKHDVKVKFAGVKTPLPYSVALSWNTTLPESAKECAVTLQSTLSEKHVKVGETVRLTTTISNQKNNGIPSTMAIIGIPAGFTAQPWQLKELQEKKVFDYYEIKGNNIAVYYRCMAPKAVKQINLDLKAEMPGVYDAPASSAYLYYTNEFKSWAGAERITIQKSGI
ncbi:MAG: MG2 domain-containing protein [Bacteroidia bacterium]